MPQLAMFAIPMSLADFFQGSGLVQEIDPLIQTRMRFWFTDKNEVLAIGFSDQLAQRLIGI
jgi:hypothetical protein